MRILFIEDHEEVCGALHDALDRIAFSIAEFKCIHNLHDGANEIALFNPTIILLDLGLPDSLSEETLERVNDFNKFAPVIVISGSPQYFQKAFEKGAYDFLYKPTFLAAGVEAFLAHAIKRARYKWLHDHGNATR